MRNLGTIVAAAVLAVVLLAYMCTFQVRFMEVAIKKTWGKPADMPIVEPGLKLKWPWPIQSVVVYDRRKRLLEDRTEETRTADAKNVLLTTFTIWRIADPSRFHTNFPGGVQDGESKLRTTIITKKQAVVGQRRLKDFISIDPEERKIREVERELRDAVARDAREQYGIEIVDLGIKKLGLPQAVTKEIFASMKAKQEQLAQRYRSEGEAQAQGILANANAARDRIMAAAQQKVAEIETEAQRIVSSFYEEFNEFPELRTFLDQLRTVRDALRQRTTLILDTSESPWSVFDPAAREALWREKKVPAATLEAGAFPRPAGRAADHEVD